MNLLYSAIRIFLDIPLDIRSYELHPRINVFKEMIIGTKSHTISVDGVEVMTVYIDDVLETDTAIKLFTRSLSIPTRTIEITNFKGDNENEVRYVIFGQFDVEQNCCPCEDFVVDYSSEEGVFQQSVLNNFDSTDMKYVFAIRKSLVPFIGREEHILIDLKTDNLKKICEAFKIEVQDDYY